MTKKSSPIADATLDKLVAEVRADPIFAEFDDDRIRGNIQNDPTWPDWYRERERRHAEHKRLYDEAVAPVHEELRAIGIEHVNIWHLEGRPRDEYLRAVPVLARWLSRVKYPWAKVGIARALWNPLAAEAYPALMAEFKRLRDEPPSEERWSIGGALGALVNYDRADEYLALAADRQYGKDRDEIILSLVRIKKDPRVFHTVVGQLDDPDDPSVENWTVMALRKLADPRARDILERYVTHPEPQVRNNAKKGLQRIDNEIARAEGRPIPFPSKRRSPTDKPAREPKEWPGGLPHDALVVLVLNNLVEIESLAGFSKSWLLARRGIGPTTIERIEQELRDRGLAPLSD